MSRHTPGPRSAIEGGDKREWERPGCGFVLGPDNETVIGRFPIFADAVLDAAAPDLLVFAQSLVIYQIEDDDRLWLRFKGTPAFSVSRLSPMHAILLRIEAARAAVVAKAIGAAAPTGEGK